MSHNFFCREIHVVKSDYNDFTFIFGWRCHDDSTGLNNCKTVSLFFFLIFFFSSDLNKRFKCIKLVNEKLALGNDV